MSALSGATNGQWVFSVMQYIPSSSTGTTFVILMNTYRPPYGAADLNWSVQIYYNMDTGHRLEQGRTHGRSRVALGLIVVSNMDGSRD